MLVKALANETNATFIKLSASQLVQKNLGDGPKMIRDIFRIAKENSPSIIFIDDMSAIAIISAATSSTSMALIGILNTMTGHKDKEDPITSLMREQSQVTRELIEYIKNDKAKSQSIRLGDKEVSLTEGSTNIHVSEDDIVWGKDEKPKK